MERSPGSTSLVTRLLLAGGSLLLCFGLLEGVLRVLTPPAEAPGDEMMVVRSSDARLVYELRPSHHGLEGGVPVRTNSAGFRGEEFPAEKEPGVFRIAVVGDSVTFGLRVRWQETFPVVLERELHRAGHPVEVLAFGVPGYNSLQEVELIRTRVLDYQPDLLLVAYVLNDHKENEGLAHFFATPRSLAVQWLADRGRELYRRLVWSVTDEAFGELAELAADRGVPVAIVVFPMLKRNDDGSDRYGGRREDVAEASAANGFPSLDLFDAYLAAGFEELGLDRVHPNPRGHELAAREIAAFVERQGWLRR